MSATAEKPKKKRKPYSEWKPPARRTNTVPLTERGAFQIREAADYLSLSVATVRRLIKRGLLQRLPGVRHIVITRADCDRFLREQQDIGKIAA
jgi:excisionase family DNA binding protein